MFLISEAPLCDQVRALLEKLTTAEEAVLYTTHPTPYALCPTPYILYPTPYTLHPTPYTLQGYLAHKNQTPP